MPELAEGQLIAGKYRIERTLGTGAMGVVFAAWHVELGQRVAVKVVRPEAMTMQDAETRFRRETRAAARMRSEHAGRVFDAGMLDGGVPYMVMEFLDGNDLAAEVAVRGALPVPEAVAFVLQASEAVAEAHAAGIVHRDLKPANLFLSARPDGTRIVKVLDFGISKSATLQRGDLALTQGGALIGSPLYMSPEQMRSARDVDSRSDIWSLGVILFELLSGRPPFLEDSIAELVGAMMQPPPLLSSFRSDVPPALEQAIQTSLKRDVNERFPDVAAFAEAIAEFAPGFQVHAERARRVLRSSASHGGVLVTGITMGASDASATGKPLAPSTGSEWERGRPGGERRPLKKLAIGVALAAVLGLVALGLAKRRAVEPEPEAERVVPSAEPFRAALPSVVPPPLVALPPPSAPAVAESEAKEPAPRSAHAPRLQSAKSQPARAQARPALLGAKAAASAAPPATNSLPDFGGRR